MQKPAWDGVSLRTAGCVFLTCFKGCLKPSIPIPDVGTLPTPYSCGEVRGHKVPARKLAWKSVSLFVGGLFTFPASPLNPVCWPLGSWTTTCQARPGYICPCGLCPVVVPSGQVMQEVLASCSVPGAPLLSGSREEEQQKEPRLEGSTSAGGPGGPGSGEDRGPGSHEMTMWHILG